jgi:hypothetical protein
MNIIKGFYSNGLRIRMVAFFLFLSASSVSLAESYCDSYTIDKAAREAAKSIVINELLYLGPQDLAADVVDCDYFPYDGILEISVFTSWIGFSGNEYFEMGVTFSVDENSQSYEIYYANGAVTKHALTMGVIAMLAESYQE